MSTFNLPDLGEGLQKAEIVAWHVSEGDHVVADKAVVEVPSPQAGRIAQLFGKLGDIIKVGAPLVAFDESQELDQGRIVGELEATDEVWMKRRRVTAVVIPVKATPAVRALARRLGVDLAVISPSGRDGVVTTADVERAAKTLAEAGPLELLRGVRRAMAKRMAQAHAEVVPATVDEDADVDAWRDGEDVIIRLIRAMVTGCKAEPSLNDLVRQPSRWAQVA